MIKIDESFSSNSIEDCLNDRGIVFEIFPKVFDDNRGSFSEVLKSNTMNPKSWIDNLTWIKQINRSKSKPGVIRGLHAQRGKFCQAKLVEAINEDIYDIIVDARPDSKSFSCSKIYKLDPIIQNKLFIPRGFLHGFIVPYDSKNEAIFNYYCDNVYDKDSEICINPKSVIPKIISNFKSVCETIDNKNDYNSLFDSFDNNVYSDKDTSGLDGEKFLSDVYNEYINENKLWYEY